MQSGPVIVNNTLTGTLGILLAAKDKGLIPAVSPLIDKLLKKGLYLSPEIVNKALEIAGENRGNPLD